MLLHIFVSGLRFKNTYFAEVEAYFVKMHVFMWNCVENFCSLLNLISLHLLSTCAENIVCVFLCVVFIVLGNDEDFYNQNV